LYNKKGGAIFITSPNIPKLSNCVFWNNTASDTVLGQDIVYNSTSEVYSSGNTEGSCSSSSIPHISGNSASIVFNLDNCLIDEDEYSNYCKPRINCNEIKTKSICLYELSTEDSPCIWV
jgi:hypothetical protein